MHEVARAVALLLLGASAAFAQERFDSLVFSYDKGSGNYFKNVLEIAASGRATLQVHVYDGRIYDDGALNISMNPPFEDSGDGRPPGAVFGPFYLASTLSAPDLAHLQLIFAEARFFALPEDSKQEYDETWITTRMASRVTATSADVQQTRTFWPSYGPCRRLTDALRQVGRQVLAAQHATRLGFQSLTYTEGRGSPPYAQSSLRSITVTNGRDRFGRVRVRAVSGSKVQYLPLGLHTRATPPTEWWILPDAVESLSLVYDAADLTTLEGRFLSTLGGGHAAPRFDLSVQRNASQVTSFSGNPEAILPAYEARVGRLVRVLRAMLDSSLVGFDGRVKVSADRVELELHANRADDIRRMTPGWWTDRPERSRRHSVVVTNEPFATILRGFDGRDMHFGGVARRVVTMKRVGIASTEVDELRYFDWHPEDFGSAVELTFARLTADRPLKVLREPRAGAPELTVLPRGTALSLVGKVGTVVRH
jgi:hypothetical protein